jgi:hypothetical protein
MTSIIEALREIAAMPEAAIWVEGGKLQLRGIPRRLVPVLAEHKAEVLALLENVEELAAQEPKPAWVRCGDCVHFHPGEPLPAQSLGHCRLTATGLPPKPVRGYAACFPMAPRQCNDYEAKE